MTGMKKFYKVKKLVRSQTVPYVRPSVRAYGPERPIAMRPSYGKQYQQYSRFFPDIFPEKKYCKLVYAQQGTLTPGGAGLLATQTFRCNSVYDPDSSGGGHQPKHHDILAAVYERYCVESAKITVTFWTPGSSTAGQCSAFVTLRPTSGDAVSVTLDSWETLVENGSVVMHPLGARDGGTDVTMVKNTYEAKKMFGVKALNEDDNQALYGANPSKSPTWTIGVCPINTSDTIGAVRYAVKIEYNVISFRKKHDLAQD